MGLASVEQLPSGRACERVSRVRSASVPSASIGVPHSLISSSRIDRNMASGQTQVSSETIEKTKQQIRGLVGEIAQLSKSDMAAGGVLRRVPAAGGAGAGGGRRGDVGSGRRQASRSSSIRSTSARSCSTPNRKKPASTIACSTTSSPATAAQLVPPLSRAGDERMGGNPTRQLLVIHPLGHDNQVEGLIEIFQRADTQPATQRGYLQFLKQMCELAAEWFKNRKLRDLGDRHSLWAQADQFSRARCTKASTFAKRATRSSTKAAGCWAATA